MSHPFARTAEHVSAGHPDKFCDQVADCILDEVLRLCGDAATRRKTRTAIECLAKDHLLVVSGEVKLPDEVWAQLSVTQLARKTWKHIGYGDPDILTVIDHIQPQSPDIAEGAGTGTDHGGAGDQGVMVGYASDENAEMVPEEWRLARDIALALRHLQVDEDGLAWLGADHKTQVTLDRDGSVSSVIVAAQHADEVSSEHVVKTLLERAVKPVVGDINPAKVTINGTGRFVIGGTVGDAGVVGRKIVVDAYGPLVPVGGGAYSGKDATKVDRSAAYMARHIAKTVVKHQVGGAKECTVRLAYGIGKHQPEMVSALIQDGKDVSDWVNQKFPDLSPNAIIDQLELFNPKGWKYFQTASYGHYGRDLFPWEKIADV